MQELELELSNMKVDYKSLEIIQDKAGIIVARVKRNDCALIIKYFKSVNFRREIKNYKILSSLDIPTLNVISTTDNALLMKDVCESHKYRLGTKEDLDNPIIASLVAKWYRLLHHKGSSYIANSNNCRHLYDENNIITLDKIQIINTKPLQVLYLYGSLLRIIMIVSINTLVI